MLVYVDANCFNRPFDDQKQARVRQETEAVFRLLESIEAGLDQLAWSPALTFELSAHPQPEIRTQLLSWSKQATVDVPPSEKTRQRAEALVQSGLKALDAAHIAFAEAAVCDVLVTCDDRMLQRSRKLKVLPRVLNPVEYMEEISHGRGSN
jgi:predicted nucleic acid-binding protein